MHIEWSEAKRQDTVTAVGATCRFSVCGEDASDPVRCRGATRSDTRTAALRPILCSLCKTRVREALCGLVLLNVTLFPWLKVNKAAAHLEFGFAAAREPAENQRVRGCK
jgi:hypothetical protein